MDTNVLIRQLGGQGRLKAMINAREFVSNHDGLQFKFSGSKVANLVIITLAGDDTYTLKFYKTRGTNCKGVKLYEGIYAENLAGVFEKMGVYLSI